MRIAIAAAAAAAALFLTGAAGAATQGTIPVDPDRRVSSSGTGGPGEQRWRLDLERGKTYALWAFGRANKIAVAVRGAGGRDLAGFVLFAEAQPHGASFRAPYTGAYTVVVTCPASEAPDCGYAYSLSAGRDCAGDRSTRCAIRAGQTLGNLQMRFAEDSDWFKTSLRAGRAYTFTLGGGQGRCMLLAVRDARGAVLASDPCISDPSGSLAYTPSASGTHYVEVKPSDDPTLTYSLSVSR